MGYRLLAARAIYEPPVSFRAPTQPVEAAPSEHATEPAASRRAHPWTKFAVPAGAVTLAVVLAIFVGLLMREWNESRPPPSRQAAQIAAVLPFTPLDSGKAAQVFADELSTDVADTLGRTEFSVISPAQSFQFRGDAKARAAQGLHADILVDGDVKRTGDNLVVSVRVEDVASGLILLSNEIQRPASQAADLPDQVATFVAGAVGSDVTMRALNSVGDPKVRREIFHAFFQCPYRRDPLCDYEIGRNLVRAAPDNAIAQTTLAIQTTNVLDVLPERERPAAIAAARKAAWAAIRLDPQFGDPYIALAVLAQPNRTATEAYLRRGLAIDPDSPSLAGYMSGFLINTGRSQEALTVIQKIASRYAFLQFVPLTQIWARLQLGDDGIAVELARRGQRLWPERGLFVLVNFEAMMLEGDPAKTEALMNDPVTGPKLRDPPSAPTTQDIVRALRTRATGDVEAVSRDCAQTAAKDSSYEHVCLIAFVLLGRMDDAFRLPLDSDVDILLFFPQLAPLRADPRFLDHVKKRGLFAYWIKTHTRPDFCATEHVPVCQALATKGS